MMQLTPNRPKRLNGDDNMIPLINVVFLMLIFFMVAGQIQTQDENQLELPQSISDAHRPEQTLTVLLDVAGVLWLDEKSITLNALNQTVQDTLASDIDAVNNLHLMIKVDAELPARDLQQVLLSLQQSGIRHLSLATQLTEPS